MSTGSFPTVVKFGTSFCSLSLFPHFHTPFSPSLISLMVSVDVKHHVYLLTACRKKTQSLFHSRVKNRWVDQHSLDDVKPVVQSQQVPPIQIQPLTDIMQISCLGSLKKLQLNHRMPSNQLYNHSKYPCPNSTIN